MSRDYTNLQVENICTKSFNKNKEKLYIYYKMKQHTKTKELYYKMENISFISKFF